MDDRDPTRAGWAGPEPDPGCPAGEVDTRWTLGDLVVDPGTGTVEGIAVAGEEEPEGQDGGGGEEQGGGVRGDEPVVWTTKWRYVIVRDDESGDWCLYRIGHSIMPPHFDGVLVTSPAVFAADQPEPPVAARVLGHDGVGTTVEGPDGPVRWLLLEGFGYYVDDQDEPGRWTVREGAEQADPDWDVEDVIDP